MSENYWAVVSSEVQGPFSMAELRNLDAMRAIDDQTPIKAADAPEADWITWREVNVVVARAKIMRHASAVPPQLPKAVPALVQNVPKISSALEEPPCLQRFVYIFLALFLGSLGVHNFYAGHIGAGIGQVALGALGVLLIMGGVSAGIFLLAILGFWLIAEIVGQKKDGEDRFLR